MILINVSILELQDILRRGQLLPRGGRRIQKEIGMRYSLICLDDVSLIL